MLYLKNINQSEIELKMKFVNYKKRNNKMSLCIANKIQRPSRSILIANAKNKTGIGDLHIVDIFGNSTTVSSNKDKAEELGKFFSS